MRRIAILLLGVILLAACGTSESAGSGDTETRAAAPTTTTAPLIITTTTTAAPPPQPVCTDGYAPCLAPAVDYDCEGGSGDGPGYTGAVTVTGPDVYGLDADGDGSACEPYYEPGGTGYPNDFEPYEPDPCEYTDCGEYDYEPDYGYQPEYDDCGGYC